ncbi:putativebeta-glucanosyltransferase gel2 [Phaeomoniella chlamydospora]|uniref:1,3-beta-glucanosyltransferase n=1 Tax=Phaeomoniella chlamydospora TaxID=158046 RepID=A0A0G2F4G8_PHACM|nr:putativebeta-glucanosyltransferase gel2 [Phaeomoniella chlamydospora]
MIVGVDYQPGGSSGFDPDSGVDPLSNGSVCLRDATLMQRLGVNTIRVYNLDPDLDHDQCASIFNDAGIYMILDVNSPLSGESIDRTAPAESYTLDYLTRIFKVVEAFAPYPNTLGFFAGNEVINEDSVSEVPNYMRAVTRDLKDYISNHVSREIGVGYSAADVREVLADTFNYLSCELSNSTSSKIDFFGLNSYSWCGNSTFTESGYDDLVEQFSNTTIPVFFSEYGCNLVTPREFSEVPVIYGTQMSVLSGGLVYEYSQEPSNYGLVVLNDNDTVTLLTDYDNLQEQYNSLDVDQLTSANSTATSLEAPTCDSSLITSGSFTTDFDVPSLPSGGADLIASGVSDPNRGKLVDITDYTVEQMVYNSDGSELTGLELTKLDSDESNVPGSNDSGSSSGSGSSASGTSTASGSSASATGSSGAAASVQFTGSTVALGAGLLGMLML